MACCKKHSKKNADKHALPSTQDRLHRVSMMQDSLNPMDVAADVAGIPQRHFSGADDSIIPPSIAHSFVAKVGACAQEQVVGGMTHEGDWDARWPQLLAIRLQCK